MINNRIEDQKHMKTRRRISTQNAVSAIIGVIIMVTITVAMAAVSYAYFTGIIGVEKASTPSIAFSPSVVDKTIQVASTEINVNWIDINVSVSNATSHAYIVKTGLVNAGDIIFLFADQPLRGKVTVTFMYVPTNSLLGTYTFDNVY